MKQFSHLNNPRNVLGFSVVLASTGRSIFVPPGSSILAALLAAGIDVPFNCGDGKCGVCEIRVIEGMPDHGDSVLTSSNQLGDGSVLTCCSGSRSAELVLDL
jgi:vanillate O-demethylase ferredoxin subunit